ncbi:MAG: biotin transporter BioY, partial [Thermoflexales bacterium]|nr:biotin transporter BioY [Thermoflexales bacterium]
MMTLTSRPALAQAIWPQVSVWREVLVVLLGSWLVALLAQVTIPLQPVPITGQTFGVLLVGAALGARRGAMAMLVYLAQGLLGLPFFAGGASGIGRLLGPTGGYLVGFVFAAALVGWLSE